MPVTITAVHPGDYLRELLEDLDMSARRFAAHVGVSPMRISLLLRGQRPLTAELAVLFAKAFGTSSQYWLNLQTQYDLALAEQNAPIQLDTVEPLYV